MNPHERIGLWAQWKEDWIAHRRDSTRPGFRALAFYRFGRWRLGVRPRLVRAAFGMLYRMLYRHARNNYGIELPCGARVGRRVIIEHQNGIIIHGRAVIGDDCVIRQGVTLGNRTLAHHDHAPILGRGVNVGAGAKILGLVHIGDGATIGANAVVLEDVPAGALAVGVPAKIVDSEHRHGPHDEAGTTHRLRRDDAA